MTATIHELRPEPWADKMRRLALTAKAMKRTPKAERDAEWSDAWRSINRQLVQTLEIVE